MGSLPRIAVGSMGGTIAMSGAPAPSADLPGSPAPDGPALVSTTPGSPAPGTPTPPGLTPRLGARDLVASVPGLDRVARVEAHALTSVPSPSVTVRDVLAALAWARTRVEDGCAGAVLTHGTDTLEETAFLLDLLWERPEPLVVVGAMRGSDAVGADGPANLLQGVTVAADPAAREQGVLVVLDDTVHWAQRVTKAHSRRLGAFTSPDGGLAGVIDEGRLRLCNLRPAPRPAPLPVPSRVPWVPQVGADLDEDGCTFRALADAGCDGLVVAGTGAGHVSAAAAEVLGDLVSRGLPVVVATRCPAGGTATHTYAYPGSETDLISRGVVMAGKLSPWKARLLLLVAVAAGQGGAGLQASYDVRDC